MHDLNHVWGEYNNAVHDLMVSEVPLRDGLARVYRDHISGVAPLDTSLPEYVRHHADELDRLMTQRPDPDGTGTITASVQLMEDDELRAAAGLILAAASDLRDELELRRGLRNRP